MSGPDRVKLGRSQWKWLPALLLVSVAYVTVQLVLVDERRFLDYDEAVYLSQVKPGGTAVEFAAHRARGVSWIVAPAARAGASLTTTRIYLALSSAVALALVFSLWLPLLGAATWLAASLYAFTWLALFYGSEIMPNHFTALAVVAAAGALARWQGSRRKSYLGLGALLVAVAGMIRPLDSLGMVVGAVLATAPWRSRSARLTVLAATAGLLVGWGPWIVEAQTRFGGVLQRFQASGVAAGGISFNFLKHLSLTGGPLYGQSLTVPWQGVLWWLGLLFFAGWGLGAGRRRPDRAGVLLAAAGAATVMLPYMLFTRGEFIGPHPPVVAPRFLLPFYGLVSIPVAVGITAFAQKPRPRLLEGLPVKAATLIVLVSWFSWQISTARRIGSEVSRERDVEREIALALRTLASGEPCSHLSRFHFAAVEFGSGCTWYPLTEKESGPLVKKLLRQKHRVFALAKDSDYQSPVLRDWRAQWKSPTRGWVLYEPP